MILRWRAIAPVALSPSGARESVERSLEGGNDRRNALAFLLCDIAGNRAGGLDTPDAWKFAALIDAICLGADDGATPEARRDARRMGMQTICLEIFRHYEVAFAELRRGAPGYLFEQRFIVDLDENTMCTLQLWNPKTAQLCYSKKSRRQAGRPPGIVGKRPARNLAVQGAMMCGGIPVVRIASALSGCGIRLIVGLIARFHAAHLRAADDGPLQRIAHPRRTAGSVRCGNAYVLPEKLLWQKNSGTRFTM